MATSHHRNRSRPRPRSRSRSRIASLLGGITLGSCIASVFCNIVFAQEFPSRAVTILGQFGPASPPEIEARLMAPYLEKAWGKPVVVESRPGAGGLIATEAVVRAAPDGHTLLATGAGIATYKLLVKDLRFDPVHDLEPVTTYADYPGGFMTNTQVPAKTIEEFIAYARANAGKLNYASVGRTTTVFTVELLKAATGMQLHEIPYTTGGDFQTSLVRNDTQIENDTFTVASRKKIEGGVPIRPLLTIGDKRAPAFPDVPSSSEKGWYIPRNGWYALMAPKGTSKAVLDKIAADVMRYTATPEAQKHGADLGVYMTGTTPDQLRQLMERDSKAWADIAQKIGIKPE